MEKKGKHIQTQWISRKTQEREKDVYTSHCVEFSSRVRSFYEEESCFGMLCVRLNFCRKRGKKWSKDVIKREKKRRRKNETKVIKILFFSGTESKRLEKERYNLWNETVWIVPKSCCVLSRKYKTQDVANGATIGENVVVRPHCFGVFKR